MAGLSRWFRRRNDDALVAQTFAQALDAHQQGDLSKAQAAYLDVLERAPEHLDALSNLAGVHGQRGELAEARSLLERARTLQPEHIGVLLNLGDLHRIDERLADAEAAYRQAITSAPDNVDALRALGLMLLDNGQAPAALPLLEQALEQAPELAQCHYDAGLAWSQCGNFETAIERYRAALRVDRDHFQTHINLANVLRQLDRLDEARPIAENAVALAPDNSIALNNLAGVLGSSGAPAEGIPYVERALAVDPDNAAALGNYGALLASVGAHERAREVLTRALFLDPDAGGTRFTLALTDLSEGHFEAGWRNYEAGLRSGARPSPLRGLARWQGDAIPGRSLLLLPEQGIGDEIMFASCIADTIIRAQPSHCAFACDPRLQPLLERSIPGLVVPAKSEQGDSIQGMQQKAYDYESPVGSLPSWVRPSADSFPGGKAFLVCDESQVAEHKAHLQSLGPGLRVGISWRGGHDLRTRLARTINLEDWRSILSTADVQFVDLQYGATSDDLSAVLAQQGVTIHSWNAPDPLVDLDGFAALVKALDLVISIDNSTVHVAGAVGTPTWMLTPAMPDWRWQTQREDSLWYASVRLFRQQYAGQWETVMEQLARELRSFKVDS